MSDRVRKKMDDVLSSLTEIVIGGNLWNRDGMWEKGKCVAVNLRSRIWQVTLDTTIVFRGRTDSPRVFAVVCPCGAVGRFGMDNHVCSGRCQGAGVEIKISENVGEGGEFWVGARVAEEVQREDRLRDESVPLVERELGVTGREPCKEVVFESLDGPFGCIAPMNMGRDELKFYFLFAQSLTKILRDFVIKNVSVRLDPGERQGGINFLPRANYCACRSVF